MKKVIYYDINIWVKCIKKNTSKLKQIAIILLYIIIIAVGVYFNVGEENPIGNIIENNKISYDISNIPEYSGEIFIEINNNMPEFTAEDMNIQEAYYSNLENGRVRNGDDKNYQKLALKPGIYAKT